MLKKIAGFLCLAWLILCPQLAYANEFSTSYDVIYDVGEDGVTNVTQKISLKNLTSNFFASKYTLSVGSTTLTDISGSDQGGLLKITVNEPSPAANKTQIEIVFNQQIAGEGKIQNFTLKYKSKDFAQKIGKTWEVALPRIPSNTIDNYNLVLAVPVSFGDPTSISPNPKNQSSNFEKLFLTYDKDQLQKSGVSANFGTSQVFDFNLSYNLQNKSLFPVLTSVTLPSGNQYQDVIINRIDPQPVNVTTDKDGNYLAWYHLSRSSSAQVKVIGSGKVYIGSKKNQIPVLSNEQKKDYTKADKYWEKDNPLIKARLSEIFKAGTPSTTTEKASLIYRYVVDSLSYDLNRLNNNNNNERLGAVTVLNNPSSAVCLEFTDLFIALARAAGIPAREIDGFGYSLNQNLRPSSLVKQSLHAWPQYYDEQKGWVMVDPTWENTSGGIDYFNKFDSNHLALVIRGSSSQTPLTSDEAQIKLTEADFTGKAQLEPIMEIPSQIWAGLPYQIVVKVANVGNYISASLPLSITSEQLTILGQSTVQLPAIPPYGFSSYTFNFRTANFNQDYMESMEINVGGQKIQKNIQVRSLLVVQSYPILLGIIGAFFVAMYGVILGYHVHRKRRITRKKKSH